MRRRMIAVYWARPQDLDANAMRFLLGVLDAGERARVECLRSSADRNAVVAAHAMLRLLVAKQTGSAAANLRLQYEAAGRPYFTADATRLPVHVSLSHTRTCITCGVSEAGPIGVDIEDVARTAPDAALLRASMSPDDEAFVRESEPALRPGLFATLWTLREARLKAGLQSKGQFSAFAPAKQYVIAVATQAAVCRIALTQLDGAGMLRALHSERTAR